MSNLSAAACLVLTLAVNASAQQPAAATPPLDIVEVVGCLAQGAGGAWMLVKAGQAAVTKTQFTTTTELKAAAAKPLGSGQFRLIGVDVFKPSGRQGQRVVVKGVLIKSMPEPGVNVTSFQTLAPACP